jgi:T5SS/PEP-CTERM-associated repeat protein
MKTTICFLIACLSLLLGWSSVSQAANTIDPNNIGATDVAQEDPNGTLVTLTNPLADPLDLGALDLAVGDTGSGELLIDNGSSVDNKRSYIGFESGSTGVATVTGNGSQWNNSSVLYVGHTGTGTLNIKAGGVVSGYNNDIGYVSSSMGVATVSGSGSQWSVEKA